LKINSVIDFIFCFICSSIMELTMFKIIVASIIGLNLAGCATARDERMAQGAMLGGAGGAIIGGVSSGNAGGALVGGVAGAAVGAIGADMTRPRGTSKRCYFSETQQREICRSRY
jgi:hypothetical protein